MAPPQQLPPTKIKSAEAIVSLIDSYWFEQGVFSSEARFLKLPQSPSTEDEQDEKLLEFTTPVVRHTRSLSDRLPASQTGINLTSNNPNSIPDTPKLQTIPSGGEINVFPKGVAARTPARDGTMSCRGRRGRRSKGSKSLTELEFEELKGFMDLGFVFPEKSEDSSSLASLIPALQRRGGSCSGDGDACEGDAISRPYLSEAWDFFDRKEETRNLLSNWKIPFPQDESDMKHSLKFWAHTVASAVK